VTPGTTPKKVFDIPGLPQKKQFVRPGSIDVESGQPLGTPPPVRTAPTREWEEKMIGGVQMKRRQQWNPETQLFAPEPGAEWVPVHPPKEEKEIETPAEKKAEKLKKERIDNFKEERRILEKKLHDGYQQFLGKLKIRMAEQNKEARAPLYKGEDPKSRPPVVHSIEELTDFMSQRDWELSPTMGGYYIYKALKEVEGSLSGILKPPYSPPSGGSVQPPAVTAPEVRQPSVIKYDAQGNRVQ
jgi:hypothetical protein